MVYRKLFYSFTGKDFVYTLWISFSYHFLLSMNSSNVLNFTILEKYMWKTGFLHTNDLENEITSVRKLNLYEAEPRNFSFSFDLRLTSLENWELRVLKSKILSKERCWLHLFRKFNFSTHKRFELKKSPLKSAAKPHFFMNFQICPKYFTRL